MGVLVRVKIRVNPSFIVSVHASIEGDKLQVTSYT